MLNHKYGAKDKVQFSIYTSWIQEPTSQYKNEKIQLINQPK